MLPQAGGSGTSISFLTTLVRSLRGAAIRSRPGAAAGRRVTENDLDPAVRAAFTGSVWGGAVFVRVLSSRRRLFRCAPVALRNLEWLRSNENAANAAYRTD